MSNEILSEKTRTFQSIDSVIEETHITIIPEEFLNTIEIYFETEKACCNNTITKYQCIGWSSQ